MTGILSMPLNSKLMVRIDVDMDQWQLCQLEKCLLYCVFHLYHFCSYNSPSLYEICFYEAHGAHKVFVVWDKLVGVVSGCLLKELPFFVESVHLCDNMYVKQLAYCTMHMDQCTNHEQW